MQITDGPMLDTVEIKHYFTKRVDENELRERGAIALLRSHRAFALNPSKGEPLPSITYSFPPDNLMHVSASFSIPRLLFRHNARLPDNASEVWQALQIACEYVENKSGLDFKAATATVSKVHFARDILVGEANVIPTIKRLSERHLPRFNRMFYDDSTVYFKASATTIRIYSKMHEVLSKKDATPDVIEAARGNLRVEFCLTRRSVQSAVKTLDLADRTTASVLIEKVSEHYLNKALDDLSFSQCLAGEESILNELLKVYPRRRAYHLNSFLGEIRIHGERFYQDPTRGLTKTSYDYCRRLCEQAKVWTHA